MLRYWVTHCLLFIFLIAGHCLWSFWKSRFRKITLQFAFECSEKTERKCNFYKSCVGFLRNKATNCFDDSIWESPVFHGSLPIFFWTRYNDAEPQDSRTISKSERSLIVLILYHTERRNFDWTDAIGDATDMDSVEATKSTEIRF